MSTGDKEQESKLEKAVAILERDAFRCDGTVAYERILGLAQKFELDGGDLLALRQRLIDLEITIGGDPAALDEAKDGERDAVEVSSEAPESAEDAAYQNAIASYLAEAGEIELLTATEEVALMRRIRAGELAAARLADGHADPGGVLVEIRRDGAKARGAFIEANLRLVVSMAKTTTHGQMAFEDIIQEGNIGLMRAVEMFDHARGLRFSTYASWWIWAKIHRAIDDRGSLVRVPVYLRRQLSKLRAVEVALKKERRGTPPTDTELSEHLGWTPAAVQFLRDLDVPPVSLDRSAHDDGRESLGDSLPCGASLDPEETAEQREILFAIVAAIDGLGERAKLVMQMRFGLADGERHTLAQIGERLGVTRERVRQIQNDALAKIRHPARSKAIAELLEDDEPGNSERQSEEDDE